MSKEFKIYEDCCAEEEVFNTINSSNVPQFITLKYTFNNATISPTTFIYPNKLDGTSLNLKGKLIIGGVASYSTSSDPLTGGGSLDVKLISNKNSMTDGNTYSLYGNLSVVDFNSSNEHRGQIDTSSDQIYDGTVNPYICIEITGNTVSGTLIIQFTAYPF